MKNKLTKFIPVWIVVLALLTAAFTTTWNETSPQGSDPASILDDKIQEFKTAIRERVAVEHSMGATDDANTGRHRLQFGVEASRPAAQAAVSGAFYWATDTGKIWMQDGTPAWVQIGAENIADFPDAGGDPLVQYLKADGSRTLTNDMAVSASKKIDGVDVGAHTHDGAAGNGVQLAASAFAADALTQGLLSTSAGATGVVGSVSYGDFPTAALERAVTVEGTSAKIVAIAVATVGNSSSAGKDIYLGFQLDAGADGNGERHVTNGAAQSRNTLVIVHVFTGVAAGAHTVKARWKTGDAANNYILQEGSILVMELKR